MSKNFAVPRTCSILIKLIVLSIDSGTKICFSSDQGVALRLGVGFLDSHLHQRGVIATDIWVSISLLRWLGRLNENLEKYS